jgi:hypothetical protein
MKGGALSDLKNKFDKLFSGSSQRPFKKSNSENNKWKIFPYPAPTSGKETVKWAELRRNDVQKNDHFDSLLSVSLSVYEDSIQSLITGDFYHYVVIDTDHESATTTLMSYCSKMKSKWSAAYSIKNCLSLRSEVKHGRVTVQATMKDGKVININRDIFEEAVESLNQVNK